MKQLIVIISFFFAGLSFGQNISFIKSYGNSGYDYGRDVKQDLDTGYICTGSSSSFNSSADAFLMKVDSLGNFLWSYNYGGQGIEWGESVVLTPDTNYALCGYSNSTGEGGFDFYLVKADTNGVPIFEKTYGGSDWDKSYDLTALPDSGFVLVGETYSFGAGNKDGYVIRVEFGDTVWTYLYGGAQDDWFKSVHYDGDSLVVVGGTESSGAGNSDGLIVKLAMDGTEGWVQVVGDVEDDYFNTIQGYGSYYVCGGLTAKDYVTTKEDSWVYKIENDGNTVHLDTFIINSWEYDELMDLYVRDVFEDLIMAHYTFTQGIADGGGNISLDKYTGSFIGLINYWYGGPGYDKPWAVDECYDGGFITIADFSNNSLGGQNFVLIRKNVLWDWIDINNVMEFDNVTLATPVEETLELNVYPTLVENEIQINTSKVISLTEVYSMNGQLVYSNSTGDKNLDLSHLAPKMYILKITIEGNAYTQKFVKN